MMTHAKEWLLRYRKELIIGAAIFVVSTTSYALGYLSARDLSRTPIIIEQCSTNELEAQQ